MPKAVKKAKTRGGKAVPKVRSRSAKPAVRKAMSRIMPTERPKAPQAPPSPYVLALVFAVSMLITAAILFAAVRSAHPEPAPARILTPPAAYPSPQITPPSGPPPTYLEE